MSHRKISEVVSKTLNEIKSNNLPFGGITILLAGDF